MTANLSMDATNLRDCPTFPKRILLAEDDVLARDTLLHLFKDWGFEVLAVSDGLHALEALRSAQGPPLAILDWGMPRMDGLEVCRLVRTFPNPPYTILLTGRTSRHDLIAGLEGGADDYLIKPIDLDELRARLRAAWRIVELQAKLAERVKQLEASLQRERQLKDLLPICAWCRKVRNDRNYWQQVEDYLRDQIHVRFSHGICPDCLLAMQAEANDLDLHPNQPD